MNKTCERCVKRAAKDGNELCGLCIRTLKQTTAVGKAIAASGPDKIEIQARKILHELMKNNDVNIELREWDKDFSPFDALLDVAQEQVAFKEICLAKLAKLKEDEWRWDGDRAGEQLRSEITLYERSVERVTRTLERIARLGIEERMMRIAERQAAIVETAIIRTLRELELPVDVQASARTKVIQYLRAS